jgi:hypothetical protein
MLRRFTSLILAAPLLVLATAFSRTQTNPSSLVVTGLNAAKLTRRFAFALLHNGGQDAVSARAAFDEVLQNNIFAMHVVTVSASVTEDPEADKVARTIAAPANPKLPMFVLITPTAQGFSVVSSLSEPVTAQVLRIWVVGKMCEALQKNTPGAPPMDADLSALCSSWSTAVSSLMQQPAASGSSLPKGSSATPPLAKPPLTNAELDLTNLPSKQTHHLKGTWKGTASHWLCGVAQPPVDIVVVLDDHGYRMPSGEFVGNISGTLTVGGVSQGIIAADYGDGRLQTNALESLFVTEANMSLELPAHISLSRFNVKLSAHDPVLGFGYYQMLSGVMFGGAESTCPQAGLLGEALKVDLKKQ